MCLAVLAAGDLGAAVVRGRVGFVTKRGQRPNPAETVVWLEPANAASRASRPAAGTFEMITRSKTLLPHVLAIPAGSTVAFPNEDPISHNLFSLSPANMFDLGLYRKGAGKTQKFDTPGIVNVYCNVHPNMSAVIHVMPTAYYAFADGNGNYAIEAPEGKYRLVAWNEQGGVAESQVEIIGDTRVNGSVALVIDSRNHRRSQHTNKFGKTYQAPRDY